MIPNKNLEEINKKLSLLIWTNLISISILVILSLLIILLKFYFLIIGLIVVAIAHIVISSWIHVKLKAHSRANIDDNSFWMSTDEDKQGEN
jgi:ABC-type bacteriocin/lantibiotic exporter with double-glycine peptidase domain